MMMTMMTVKTMTMVTMSQSDTKDSHPPSWEILLLKYEKIIVMTMITMTTMMMSD